MICLVMFLAAERHRLVEADAVDQGLADPDCFVPFSHAYLRLPLMIDTFYKMLRLVMDKPEPTSIRLPIAHRIRIFDSIVIDEGQSLAQRIHINHPQRANDFDKAIQSGAVR